MKAVSGWYPHITPLHQECTNTARSRVSKMGDGSPHIIDHEAALGMIDSDEEADETDHEEEAYETDHEEAADDMAVVQLAERVAALEAELEAQRRQGAVLAEQLVDAKAAAAAAQVDAKTAREALLTRTVSAEDAAALVADTVGLEQQLEAAQEAAAASAKDTAALIADTVGLEEELEALKVQLAESEATVRRQEAEALALREAAEAVPAPVAAPSPAPAAAPAPAPEDIEPSEWQSPNIFHHCVSVQLHSVRGLPWGGARHTQLVLMIKAGKERHEVPIELGHKAPAYHPPPTAGAASARPSPEPPQEPPLEPATSGNGDDEANGTPPLAREGSALGEGLGSPPSAAAPLPSLPSLPPRPPSLSLGREGLPARSLSARIDILTPAQA